MLLVSLLPLERPTQRLAKYVGSVERRKAVVVESCLELARNTIISVRTTRVDRRLNPLCADILSPAETGDAVPNTSARPTRARHARARIDDHLPDKRVSDIADAWLQTREGSTVV